MPGAQPNEKPQNVAIVVLTFWRCAGGFWHDAGRLKPLVLTIMLGFVLVGRLVVDYGVNMWNRHFFDALGTRDTAALSLSVWTFLALIIGMASVGGAIVYLRETIQVDWRRWLTEKLLHAWLQEQAKVKGVIDNPEYRISDDVRLATEPMIDFAIGLFSSVIACALFIGVLWAVGGSLPVSIGSLSFTIPAYFVLAAVIMAW